MNREMNAMMHTTARSIQALVLAVMLLLGACGRADTGTAPQMEQESAVDRAEVLTLAGLQDKGVRIESVRLSAAGYMVDVRYRILDPDKAAKLVHRRTPLYLIDQASKRRLTAPAPPKIGALRKIAATLTPGRVYFTLFANPDRLLKSGDKVTIAMSGIRVADVPVE